MGSMKSQFKKADASGAALCPDFWCRRTGQGKVTVKPLRDGPGGAKCPTAGGCGRLGAPPNNHGLKFLAKDSTMATHLDLEEQEQLDQLKHFWNKWGTPITGVGGGGDWLVLPAGTAGSSGSSARRASTPPWPMWWLWLLKAGDQARVALAFDALKADYRAHCRPGQAALLSANCREAARKSADGQAALQWADRPH